MTMLNCFGCFGEKSDSKSDLEEQKEDKMQLTLKVLQSQQTVETWFDISGCHAHSVPDQTYTYCKLLKKTKLLMHNNNFSSLDDGGDLDDLVTIKVLDLHSNQFSSLPQGISQIRNLTYLDVSNNTLKHLPNSMSSLKKLVEINLNNNSFSKVPACLCALRKLRKISLLGNKVKDVPVDLHKLQSCLREIELEVGHLKPVIREIYSVGQTEELLKHFCSKAGVEYVGVAEEEEEDENGVESPTSPKQPEEDPAITSALENFMKKKREAREKQMLLEKEKEEQDISQLSEAFKKNSDDRKQLCMDITDSGTDPVDYELRRERQEQLQSSIERQMRELQTVEMEAYLSSSSGKGKMLENMATLQTQLDQEIEGVMTMKDGERKHLLLDLHEGEKSALAVMQEIVSASVNKNAAFVSLIEEQDKQLEELVSSAGSCSKEVRKGEVVAAMQEMLSEAVLLEQRARQSGVKEGWISSLIEDSNHSEMHVEDVLSSQKTNKEDWVNMLLHDEECQAAAFKLLLLNNDLKRNNLVRQINQVSLELARLSSLELRKKLLSLQYGSTTMLDQRKTLVGILKSLITQKSNRETELEGMLSHLEDINSGAKEATDYWLVQYQRLMEVKPAGLAEAEDMLEKDVIAVLEDAFATDLVPILARYEITFAKLMAMTAENFEEIGIGLASYHSIQRSLQKHLATSKLSTAPPMEEFDECGASSSPSAPPSLEVVEAEERAPSAPPSASLFLESECVVCLEENAAIILIPCGHVCVCPGCSGPISVCPMCRGGVADKLPLTGAEAVQ